MDIFLSMASFFRLRSREKSLILIRSSKFHPQDIYNITNDDKKSSKLRVYVRDDTIGEYQCVSWFGSAALTSVTARLTLATISLENEDERPPADQVIRWHASPQNSVLIKCGNVTSIPPPSWSFYK